ncbi:MAG: TRAP transporter small permease [Bacteroidetes bacterium]|nr:MAG: TRAP transporter small permease [Bacteroidota bacterium]
MVLMVVNVTWQVVSRYILGDSSSWTEELTRFLLIWVGLLGAAYAAGQRLHLAIDLLPRRLEGKSARRLDQVIQSCMALFALLAMVIGGSRLVYLTLTLKQTSAALGLPLWYVYLVLPLSGLLIIYYSLANMLERPAS